MPEQLNSLPALKAAGLIRTEASPALSRVVANTALAITPQMAALIQAEQGEGPVSKQFLPTINELNTTADERHDPTGDLPHSPVPGLIHRHADRVLLKVTSMCAVYCRFCFRKDMIGPAASQTRQDTLDKAIAYISDHKEIREVILSGGDPLMLSADRLAGILTALARLDHLIMIRIHTRIPIVDSKRITDKLIHSLKTTRPVYVVLHCNHARELTPAAIKACSQFIDHGIPLLSQSVLLRGVNDDVATLTALFYRLAAARIKPYYLHHPDRARGTGHFRVSIKKGQQLMAELRKNISGLCLPTYVLEIPGGYGKIPIGPDYVTTHRDNTHYLLKDYAGKQHVYKD